MRKINIQFTSPDKPTLVSRAICWFLGTPYSHVRFTWESRFGFNPVYEASGIAVRFVGPLAQAEHPVKIYSEYTLELSDDMYGEVVASCLYFAGVKYGVVQLFRMGWYLISNKKSRSDGDDSMVCSELVCRILSRVRPDFPFTDLDYVTPKDLELWCRTNLQTPY